MRPFMGLMIAFLTLRRYRRDGKNRAPTVSKALQRALQGFATSRALLLGKTILAESRLSEGSFQPNPRFAFD